MKISKNIPIYYLLIQFLYIILLFQIALQYSSIPVVSTIFNYADDAIAALCMAFVGVKLLCGFKLQSIDSKILQLYFCFSLIGFFSSLFYQIQPIEAGIFDFLTCSKFVFGYLAARIFCKKFNQPFLQKILDFPTKLITVIFFILSLNDEFLTPLFPVYDYRYFGRSIALCYPHPTYLAAACIAMMIILAITNRKNENIKYLVMLSITIIFTFRVKAIAFLAVYWALYILRYLLSIKNKFVYFVSSALLALYIGYDQITTYFTTTTWSPRYTMLSDAISLAFNYFPLGAGFGTFGTNMSVVYYSNLYHQLGYEYLWGLSKEYSMFLNDNLWAALLGQFGVIGSLFFIWIIILFFKVSFQESNGMKPFRFVAVISLNIYLIIASLGEMAYFATYAILFFLILGAILDENRILRDHPEEDEGSSIRRIVFKL